MRTAGWIFLFSLGLLGLMACQTDAEKEPGTRSGNPLHENTYQLRQPLSPADTLNVGFLVLDSVYNSELMGPWDIFHHTIFHTEPGMRVFSVARTEDPVTTFEGIRFFPDYSLDNAPRIDILAVPSALHNLDTDLEDQRVIDFVRDRGRQARFIISFCDGAFILAEAGLLTGLHTTTFPSDIDAFEERFADRESLEVHREVIFVADGNAITSAGGARSYDPAMYLVERLYGRKVANGIAKGMVIDWKPEEIPHFIAPKAQ